MSSARHSDAAVAAPVRTAGKAGSAKSERLARDYLCLDDFERKAHATLPRFLFEFVQGGAETQSTVRSNREQFARYEFIPRVLRDTSRRSQRTSLFGNTYDAPFGISPMGGAPLCAYRGDLALAKGSQRANVPMILSGGSMTRLEDIKRESANSWFQAYLAGDDGAIERLLRRVEAAGYETLVITVDLPVNGNRERNRRNGYRLPVVVTPKVAWDSVRHPSWLLGTAIRTLVRHGMPHFENQYAERGLPILSRHLKRSMTDRDKFSWKHIERIRQLWPGNLVIKGILSGEDGRLARETGANGVIVSNHGGRQLDYAVSSLGALPEVVDGAGDIAVMLDGGVRRGSDVLKALALGASFVFLARPFLFSAVVGGEDGVGHAIGLLKEEVDRNMALLGLDQLAEVSPSILKYNGTRCLDTTPA